MRGGAKSGELPLARWVWRAWSRAALVPLVVVEAVIIVVYLIATAYGTQVNLETTRGIAIEELGRIATREAAVIDRDLTGLGAMTRLFADQARRALDAGVDPGEAERARYRRTPEGMYHSEWDPAAAERGQCSVYASALHKPGEVALRRVAALAALDPLAADLLRATPVVAQVYLNTHDSLNRICPGIRIEGVFPPDLDVRTFNFYYLADERNNPSRGQVWTDAYVDPAGRGWIASSIAPVYRGDFLEGVVGLDVTLERFANQILNLAIPWRGYGVLVARDGTLLAMPREAERDFGLAELTQHDYAQAIRQDTFKPESYNVFKRGDLGALAEAVRRADGVGTLNLQGSGRLVATHVVPSTGWHLAVIVPEGEIFRPINELDASLRETGYWMIAGVFAFYGIFMLLLLWQSRVMASGIVAPLARMDAMTAAIGQGQLQQRAEAHPVVEIQRTFSGLVAMGAALEQAARDVEAARDEAIAASRLKSEFLASVSHEIRTPMNGVIGVAELLGETPLDGEQRAYVSTIRTSAEALLGIINDILDLAKLEAGGLEVREAPFDPAELTESALDVLVPRADSKGLLLVSRVDPEVPVVALGDAGRIRQVILNLVGNAVKFTDAGHVEVRLRVEAVEPERGGRLRWEVTDTGPGVPEGLRTRLFEPFSQLDGTAARRFGGTGLGLSIARRIVEVCGGEAGFEAPETGGARFWFALPLRGAERGTPQEAGRGAQGTRVLVCSARRVVREAVASWLGRWRIEVLAVDGLEAALEALSRGEWAVCILDATLGVAARAAVAEAAREAGLLELGGEGGVPLRRGALSQRLRELLGHGLENDAPRTGRTARLLAAKAEGRPLALVVEDHEVSRFIVERRLAAAGYEAVVCDNGEEALRLHHATSFPLVLLDVRMPGVGGLEVVRRMREREAQRGSRGWIVAVTAGAMEGDRARCLEAGMDDFLAKPFTAEQFDAMLARSPLGV
jgi:signal transduction histidine kinase/CheY-like chemotaxis protein